MELVFDERGLLVPGVHEVSLETVKDTFGRFQRTDCRPMLFARLIEYLDAIKRAGCGECVVLDGSFVMACIDEPDDIDLVLLLPAGWDMLAALKPYQYNLVSKKAVKTTYRFDLFTAEAGSAAELTWIEFFGQVNPRWAREFGWPKDLRKGILRVIL